MAKKEVMSVGVTADTKSAETAIDNLGAAAKDVGAAATDSSAAIDKMSDKAASAAEAAAEAEKKAAKKISSAYESLGVVSNAVAEKRRKKILDDFETIKKSGSASAAEIARAWERTQVKLARVDESIGKHRITWQSLGGTAKSVLGGIGTAIGKTIKIAAGMGAAIAGGATAVGYAIYRTAKSTADYADEIGKMSTRSGISAKNLSALRMAAEQSEIGFDQLGGGLKNFNLVLGKSGLKEKEVFAQLRKDIAAAGGDEDKIAAAREAAESALNDPFKALGVKTRDARGNIRSTMDLLKEVFDKIKAIPDPAQRLEMSSRFFRKEGGNAFLTLINEGSKGLSFYEGEVKRLGIEVSDDMAKQAQEFNDSLDTMGKSWLGLKLAVGKQVLGQFTELFKSLTDTVVENRDVISEALGRVAKGFVSVIQDLVKLFKNPDADVQNEWLKNIYHNLQNILPTWDQMQAGIEKLGPALEKLASQLMSIAEWTGKVFDGLGKIGHYLNYVNPVALGVTAGYKMAEGGQALYNKLSTGTWDGTGWDGGTLTDKLAGMGGNPLDSGTFTLPTPQAVDPHAVKQWANLGQRNIDGTVYNAKLVIEVGGKELITGVSEDGLKSFMHELSAAERKKISAAKLPWESR